MKPSEISSSLHLLSRIQKPAFLWGPPGVGKSQVVAQVAATLGIRLIDIRAILLDPVDLRGLPTVDHGKAAWAIPAFLPDDGAGILFLDELNAAPPLVQAACYQLVLDGSMQTRGVHYDAMQSDALEDAFRTRYSGFCPANGDEATAAIAQ